MPATPPRVIVTLLKPERINNVNHAPRAAAAKHDGASPTRSSAAGERSSSLKTESGASARHAAALLASTRLTDAPMPTSAVAAPETTASSDSAPTAASSAKGVTADAASSAAPTAPKGERFALLPSIDLRYDTFFNGAKNQGGTIHWRTNGRTYELIVSIPLPFIGTYSYTSRGQIDAFGLAPDVYIEQRGRRGTDFTRFLREPPSPHAVFTRNTHTVPLPDGAQDRFSMIFQLASLVRGDPKRYQPGVTRQFFVLDDDSGENWPIQTMGPDRVLGTDGPIDTWHFMRLPRHDGDRRRIDVWLAPSLDWLPVRIMQTEPNGTQVELLFRSASRTSTGPGVSQTAPSVQTEGNAAVPAAPSDSIVPQPATAPAVSDSSTVKP